MDRKLAEFVTVLRRHGLGVSPPEVADAARAISLVGYGARDRFREALGATLAKSQPDRVLFEHCFDTFFRIDGPAAGAGSAASAPAAAGSADDMLPGQGQAGGGGSGSGGGEATPGVPPSGLGADLLAADDSALALRLAQAAADSRLASMRVLTQKGLFGRRMLLAMGLDDLERELAELDGSVMPQARRRAALLRERLLRLRVRVRDAVERSYRLLRDQDRDALLRDTDFALLRESDDVRTVVRRMARRLVNRHRRRERQAARGQLDVRATLRRNLAHDGVLMDPAWKRIRRDRPRVLAVCDISRSVSQQARFLLLVLYSLQEVIPRLRTFVFTNTLHEVTDLFARQTVEAALDEVMARHGLGSTDYGRALAQLDEQAGSAIDRRTTLVFLGDARNNRGEARLDLLQRFHARARQLVWLNPEDRGRWGSGDSEMLRYATACSQACCCRNLADLERIVDRLLRRA